jgi:hypothetical protein
MRHSSLPVKPSYTEIRQMNAVPAQVPVSGCIGGRTAGGDDFWQPLAA